MENIVLGEEQQQALDYIKKWILDSKETSCAFSGAGGTGKTFTLRVLLNWLNHKKIPYIITAPTHKATLVVKQYTNQEAVTLHSLLALSPIIDILELDFNELKFNCGDCRSIPKHGLIICDEASMVNDELFKFIQEKCKERDCKVLYTGDRLQLSPVNSYGYSKVWNISKQVHLTKIYRQDNESALVPVLSELRKHYLTHFYLDIREKGSTFVFVNGREFLDKIVEQFRVSIRRSDVLNMKVLAYTNNKVKLFNNGVHKLLFDNEREYNKLGFLTGYDNVTWNNTQYHNGMDYIIIDEPKKIDIIIPSFGVFPAYSLELYDSLDSSSDIIHILSKEIDQSYYDHLAEMIEERRMQAVKCKNKARKGMFWKFYFEMINAFCSPIDLYFDNRLIRRKTFDHGYASSVHKA